MNSNVYKIYTNCIPIKGATRSIIYDLGREKFDFIPNKLFSFLKFIDGKSEERITQFITTSNNSELFKQYLHFLNEKQYIFLVPKEIARNFKRLNEKVKSPYLASSCIVKIHSTLDSNWTEIFKCIISSGAFYIDFHFHFSPTDSDMIFLITYLARHPFKEIGFIFFSGLNFPIDKYEALILGTLINRTIGFNCLKEYHNILGESHASIDLYTWEYKHTIYPQNFSINNETFFEAKNHNLYFFKKLILSDMAQSNIGELALRDITTDKIESYFQSRIYTELNSAAKDKIHVCKSCEFRYMCVDSRIPVKNSTDNFYYTDECNYNPYLCKWSSEPKYLTLDKCGIVIEPDKGVVINRAVLKKALNNAWL